jgi:hypothetical protein
MKHILEYEDHEIQDLLGSLNRVGQAKQYKGTLWAHFNIYRLFDDYWSHGSKYVCFLETDPFYGTGDEAKDNSIMLQHIQNGDFVRPKHPDAVSWASLRNGNQMAVDFLEKRKVQSLAKTCSTMDELMEQIRENLVRAQQYALRGQLNKTKYMYNEEAASKVLVYGFIAPIESDTLVTSWQKDPFKGSSAPQKYRSINYRSINYSNKP